MKKNNFTGADSDYRDTDWKFDFSSLPRWDNRDKIPFIYDKFYPVPQMDILCCIYSIAEVTMGRYIGFLAILKNKNDPELLLNVTEKMCFQDYFFVSNNKNLLFFRLSVSDKSTGALKDPMLIIDIEKGKFSYYDTHCTNSGYTLTEISESLFAFEIDEAQRKNNEALNALADKTIDLKTLKWYDLNKIDTLPKKLF